MKLLCVLALSRYDVAEEKTTRSQEGAQVRDGTQCLQARNIVRRSTNRQMIMPRRPGRPYAMAGWRATLTGHDAWQRQRNRHGERRLLVDEASHMH